MPLYEYLIIAKAGEASRSVRLLHSIIEKVLTTYPYAKIREAHNLGDRVLGVPEVKNKMKHNVGRYLQILVDAPPSVGQTIRDTCNSTEFSGEIFRGYMHKVNDLDYSVNMYFRAGKYIDQFNKTPDYEYAQKIMDMKEKIENFKKN